MYKTGLASIAFRQLSVEEIIAAAKAAGLSYIEWGSDVHAPKDDLENIDRIRRLTEEAGLKCSSYGTYYFAGRDDPEEIRGYITAAKRLGVSILRIWCAGHPYELPQEEIQKRYEACRQIAKIAEEENVMICAECHSGNLTHDLASSLNFMEAVNSPHFKMYWQPCELLTTEENIAFIKGVLPYVTNVHVYHYTDKAHHPLSEGKDAWTEYVRALGKDRLFILEHMPEHDPALLPLQAATLKAILR